LQEGANYPTWGETHPTRGETGPKFFAAHQTTRRNSLAEEEGKKGFGRTHGKKGEGLERSWHFGEEEKRAFVSEIASREKNNWYEGKKGFRPTGKGNFWQAKGRGGKGKKNREKKRAFRISSEKELCASAKSIEGGGKLKKSCPVLEDGRTVTSDDRYHHLGAVKRASRGKKMQNKISAFGVMKGVNYSVRRRNHLRPICG